MSRRQLQLVATGARGAETPVTLRRDRLTRLLGAPVPDGDVRAALAAISPVVQATAEGWQVAAPAAPLRHSHRG